MNREYWFIWRRRDHRCTLYSQYLISVHSNCLIMDRFGAVVATGRCTLWSQYPTANRSSTPSKMTLTSMARYLCWLPCLCNHGVIDLFVHPECEQGAAMYALLDCASPSLVSDRAPRRKTAARSNSHSPSRLIGPLFSSVILVLVHTQPIGPSGKSATYLSKTPRMYVRTYHQTNTCYIQSTSALPTLFRHRQTLGYAESSFCNPINRSIPPSLYPSPVTFTTFSSQNVNKGGAAPLEEESEEFHKGQGIGRGADPRLGLRVCAKFTGVRGAR